MDDNTPKLTLVPDTTQNPNISTISSHPKFRAVNR
jgi:hypothetical protein